MPTRDHWAIQFAESARAHWTAERIAQLAGGKELLIDPARAPVLLRALGLLHRDATMPPTQHRKFFQINHMVRLLEPAIAELHTRHGALRLIDVGCGRSYLSLLLAWCAREQWGYRLEVLGIDRNAELIEECRRRTALAELDDVVQFSATDIDSLGCVGDAPVHAVLALHACDTATCDAIALGIALGAELIAVAPCCHAELARGWSGVADSNTVAFGPALRIPHLRREIASHITDTMRVLLLRDAGYQVTATEFVGAEHSAKNTLVRARRAARDPNARAEYDALVATTGGCGIRLAVRLASSQL